MACRGASNEHYNSFRLVSSLIVRQPAACQHHVRGGRLFYDKRGGIGIAGAEAR